MVRAVGRWKERQTVRARVVQALEERGWMDGEEMMTDEIISLLPDVPERSIRGALLELANLGVMEGCSITGKTHYRQFWRKADAQ